MSRSVSLLRRAGPHGQAVEAWLLRVWSGIGLLSIQGESCLFLEVQSDQAAGFPIIPTHTERLNPGDWTPCPIGQSPYGLVDLREQKKGLKVWSY